MSDSTDRTEPQYQIALDEMQLTLLGTAHISHASTEQVRRMLRSGHYDAVAVELCRSRHQALTDPKSLARMDLFSVIRENRVYMVVASLALSAYQKRLADQLGIEPGAEQRMALRLADELGLPVMLVDREIGITLKRITANLGWWKRYTLFTGLLAAMLTSEQVTEEEVERLKEGDVLETTFAEFAADRQDLYLPLIDERDRYMAAKLRREAARTGARRVLAVIGAGHLRGTARYLEQERDEPGPIIAELERLPPPGPWPRRLGWLLVALLLGGFAWGFAQNPDLGWELVGIWVFVTGGLAALGTLLAGGHPLTILSALLAAPLTTLHPAIGVGMVTGFLELALRKPRVGDFGRLREDVASWRGWWRNRVSRVFLVFLFSSLGAAIGTYVAGFRIADQLFRA